MARKRKALEDENATLKTLLAEAMLDNAVLKEEVRVPAVADDYSRACLAPVAYNVIVRLAGYP